MVERRGRRRAECAKRLRGKSVNDGQAVFCAIRLYLPLHGKESIDCVHHGDTGTDQPFIVYPVYLPAPTASENVGRGPRGPVLFVHGLLPPECIALPRLSEFIESWYLSYLHMARVPMKQEMIKLQGTRADPNPRRAEPEHIVHPSLSLLDPASEPLAIPVHHHARRVRPTLLMPTIADPPPFPMAANRYT